MKSLRISVESGVLMAICLADMFVTLYFVSRGMATEQNPIMAAFMNRSPALFVIAKIGSFVPFVVAVELYKKKNPDFALKACRCAIAAYVVVFSVLTFTTNMA